PHSSFFPFTPPSPPHIFTLSLHDALPISSTLKNWLARGFHSAGRSQAANFSRQSFNWASVKVCSTIRRSPDRAAHLDRCPVERRSEEHTSELQSRFDLVCRLLLEKKK